MFMKRIIAGQNAMDINIFKRWRSLNYCPKTLKVIREILEDILCVGKRKELITKQKSETRCWCSKSSLQLNSDDIIRCCKSVWRNQ